MRKTILPLAIGLALAVLASCSMEKRHYMKGYHVEWNSTVKNDAAKKDAASVTSQPAAVSQSAAVTEQQSAPAQQAVAAQPQQVIPAAKTSAVSKIFKATQVQQAAKPAVKNSAAQTTIQKAAKPAKRAGGGGPSKGVLILLAILIPFVAVGLVTDWDGTKVLIAVLLSLFTCLGGIIYALIIVSKEG